MHDKACENEKKEKEKEERKKFEVMDKVAKRKNLLWEHTKKHFRVRKNCALFHAKLLLSLSALLSVSEKE
jgi:hypothetical protein